MNGHQFTFTFGRDVWEISEGDGKGGVKDGETGQGGRVLAVNSQVCLHACLSVNTASSQPP